MTATSWEKVLENNIASESPFLEGTGISNPELLDSCLPGLADFVPRALVSGSSSGAVSATGTVDILSHEDCPASLTMEGSLESWAGRIVCKGPGEPVTLPFFSASSIADLTLEVGMAGSRSMVMKADPKISGVIRAGDRPIPLSLRATSRAYRVRITDRSIPLAALGEVLSTLGCGSLTDALPVSGLSGELLIQNLDLQFEAESMLPSELSLSIGLPGFPTPMSGVALEDVSFSLTARNVSVPEHMSFNASVAATLIAGGTRIGVFGSLPEFAIAGRLRSENGVPLRAFLEPFADSGWDIPDLSIQELDVSADFSQPVLAVRCVVDGDWPIPNTSAILRDLRFDLELSKDNPHVSVYALTDVQGTPVLVDGTLGPEVAFAGQFEPATLSDLLGRFDLTKPPEVPEVQFGPTDVVINGSEKTVRVQASAYLEHDFFDCGVPVELDLSVNVDIQPGKKPAARLAVEMHGRVPLSDDFEINALSVTFVAGGGSWTAEGALQTALLGSPLDLTASYTKAGADSQLRFALTRNLDLIELEGVASLRSRSIWVDIEQREGRRSVSVAGLALFGIDDLLEYDAELTLSDSGFRLRPNPNAKKDQSVAIPVGPGPAKRAPAVVFEIAEVAVTKTRGRGRKPGWKFLANLDVSFESIPAPADVVFNENASTGVISVDSKEVSISIDPSEMQPIDLSIGDDPKLPLPILEIQSIFLRRIDGKRWDLGAALLADHFDRLNRFAGGSALFADTLALDLLFGDGLTMRPRTSPFRDIRLRTLEDGTVWTVFHKFGGVGKLSFQVPELAFDFKGGRWRAAGGVMAKGALSLPLTPVKWLAKKCGLPKAFVNKMPDGMPLRNVNIASPRYVDTALDQLGKQNKSTEAAFRKFAEILKKGAENFPDEFSEYLSIHIPKEFRFDVAIEPGGGAHIDLGVIDDQPLKVAFPSVVGVPPLPGLMGLSLYKVGFGLTGGGSVGVLKFDGWVDRLDLVNLGYALATGNGKDIANRITLRDLVALVPMAAPVPMPLFYRTLSWRYKNLLGLGMEIQASFPDPEPSVADWARLIIALLKFFFQGDFYLHKKGNLPEGMSLPFKLGPARIALPGYLGGAEIGLKSKLPALRVEDTLARAVDGIKAGNAGWVIEAVPLNYKRRKKTHWPRIANVNAELGPFSFKAVACVTTDHEFRNVVLKNRSALKLLAAAEPEQMLGCTPANMGGKSYDKGFLILLMGSAAVRAGKVDLFRYRAQFGMALTGPGDFQTAIKKEINFGPDGFIAIHTSGLIRTRALPKEHGKVSITIQGELALLVFNKRYALGSKLKVIPGRLFEATIRLVLADDFILSGTLRISNKEATISGHVVWDVPGKAEIRVRCSASISKDGVTFEPAAVKIGELSTRLFLTLPGKRRSLFNAGFEVELPPGFTAEFRKGLKTTANKVVGEEVKQGYSKLLRAIASQDSYEVSLRGIRTWLPATCTEVLKIVSKKTTKKSVKEALDHWASLPKKRGKRLGRRAAVALVKPFAHKEINEGVQPWKDKLKAVRKAARARIDKNYRKNLKKALGNLIKSNVIDIRIAEYKKFPGLRVYRHSPVLSKAQVRLVKQAIKAIDALPAATRQRVKAQRVLASMPKGQRIMADVKNSIDQGVDSGIPNIRSVRFEKSVRPLLPDDVSLRVEFAYKGKIKVVRLETNLWKADKLPKQIAKAFAEAF